MARARYRQIAAEIAGRIRDGEFLPGSAIYSVREMTQRYSISSPVALRVFKELVSLNLITRSPGLGYRVCEQEPEKTARNLICLFHPLSNEEENGDNFGNRILYGIMKEALACRRNVIFPQGVSQLANRVPSDEEFSRIVDEIFCFSDISCILVDSRISDESLRRFLLPRVENIPVAVVGRSTSLPVCASAVPAVEIGTETALWASRISRNFYLCQDFNRCYITSDYMTVRKSFREKLEQLGVPGENIQDVEHHSVFTCGGPRLTKEILPMLKKASLPPFFFCESDYLAEGVLKELESFGFRCGRDFWLLGFGGIWKGASFGHHGETIALNAEEIGSNAVKLLCENVPAGGGKVRFCSWKIRFSSEKCDTVNNNASK